MSNNLVCDVNKSIAILGSTGSVGEQALDVAVRSGMNITALSANNNYLRVEEQARKYSVKSVAMANEIAAKELKIRLADTDIKVFSGTNGICEMIEADKRDVVVNSIIGKAGLLPTLSIINSGARLALANKESLVVAGEIVMAEAKKRDTEVLPVDSEHCAIHQCLTAGKRKEIKRLWLTASGGPFFGKRINELKNITPQQALAHPTWKMGAKITIDSATLMNKGFEIIEAAHLFDVAPENIDVVIHRESIIHSMVEYIDNSIFAQMSVPDLRFCVQYATAYPDRIDAIIPELDLFKVSNLTFSRPDYETFALLALARKAIKMGGALPAVLNAANEVAVELFLSEKIGFYDITEGVHRIFEDMSKAISYKSLEEILNADREARELAYKYFDR